MAEKKNSFLLGLSLFERIIFWGLLAMVFIAPVLFTTEWYTNFGDKTGPIGDTIGGLTAPFINLLAAFLVFISFRAQIEANKQQRAQHKEEMIQIRNEFNYNSIIKEYDQLEANTEKMLSKYDGFENMSVTSFLKRNIINGAINKEVENQAEIFEIHSQLLYNFKVTIDNLLKYKETTEMDFSNLKIRIRGFLVLNFLNAGEYEKYSLNREKYKDHCNRAHKYLAESMHNISKL